MTVVPFTEFRRNVSGLLSRVERGETIVVTRHGRAVAEVGPVTPSAGRTPSWKRPGLRLTVPGAALSAAILEERNREGLP
jgi:prevent-host-death family protein